MSMSKYPTLLKKNHDQPKVFKGTKKLHFIQTECWCLFVNKICI